jgi:hypothetical protein
MVLLPPRVSHDQAEEIAVAHYGVSAVAERLAAEHDDTFRLVTAGGPTRLLKVAQISPGTPADAGASSANEGPKLIPRCGLTWRPGRVGLA